MDEADRIDSWKQIAAYLDKSERTVRRWYSREGLPIHKHVHQERGSVWAFKAEIDKWLESRKESPAPLLDAPALNKTVHARLYLAFALLASSAAAYVLLFTRHAPPALMSEPEVFTSLPGSAYSPAISPDGSKVAFYWRGIAESDGGIYIKEIGSESLRQVIPAQERDGIAFVYNADWSPDGHTIAYLRRQIQSSGAPIQSFETQLMLVDSNGKNERQLIRLATGRVFYANSDHISWTQDGKRILAPMADGARRGIFWIPLDGSQPVQLTDAGQDWEFAPTLSPNEDGFYYFRTLGPPRPHSEQMIYQALNPDGTKRGPARLVHSGNTMTSGVAWLPSGKEIFYCREERSISGSMRNGMYRMPTDAGSTPTPLFVGPCQTLSIRKSGADGRTLLVFGSGGSLRGSIYGGSMSNIKDLGHLVPSSRFEARPKFSPDGSMLAFVSNRSGRDEIWISSRDGSNPRKLTNNSYIVSEPVWSPDGRRILYGVTLPPNLSGNPSVPHRLMSLLVNTGVTTQIPLGTMQACDPTWAPDGEIYFWTFDVLWKASLDGSQVRKLGNYANHVGSPQSVDGKYLFYSRRTNPFSIYRLDLTTGEEEFLADHLQSSYFHISSTKIYFIDSDRFLATMPLNGGAATKIFSLSELKDAEVLSGLALTRDETSIAFSSYLVQMDLMLVRDLL